ncbi:MAG TPA: hypothetical protein VJI46_06000 [Candidatus Nanoarchaeia archaeon]|nr:hypothetical protein [Candidatus Nanoarchaeia archaeon]
MGSAIRKKFSNNENRLEDFVGMLGAFEEKIPSTKLQRKWRNEFAKRNT